MPDDPRLNSARYRVDRDARARGEEVEQPNDAGTPTPDQRSAYVETAIQQAIRRGEFDNLPGAGKPLEGLSDRHDPDWWIRRKIERERLGGLAPPAIGLRVENLELDERLDAMARDDDVRRAVDDFNARIIEARRQLQGGPPVVTPTRDVEDEVRRWRERRAARRQEADRRRAEAAAEEERLAAERRAARRARIRRVIPGLRRR